MHIVVHQLTRFYVYLKWERETKTIVYVEWSRVKYIVDEFIDGKNSASSIN